jgi:hypothetical protein
MQNGLPRFADLPHVTRPNHESGMCRASVEQETPNTITTTRGGTSSNKVVRLVKDAASSKLTLSLAAGVLGFILGKGGSIARLFFFM